MKNSDQPTQRQRRFVSAYLESGDPEQAALAAGFSAKRAQKAGEKLLTAPAVQTALRQAWRSRPRAYAITEQAILRELSAVAFSDFTDFVRVEDGQVLITDSRNLDYSRRAAIAGIKDTGKGVEIKLHDKQKALELLVKYLGLFDRTDSPGEHAIRVELGGAAEWAE